MRNSNSQSIPLPAPPPRRNHRSALFAMLALAGSLAFAPDSPAQPPVSPADDGAGAHSLFTPAWYRSHRATRPNGSQTPSGAASTNDLTYHGGPVMRDPTNYVIIWNPPGSTFGATYQQMIEQYFTDVADTPYMTINSQWGDSSGLPVPNTNHFGGTWVDTANAYPHAGTYADPLTRADIQAEIDRAITANPTWQAPGLSTMYFVYIGKDIIECKGSGDCFAGPGVPDAAAKYCAYHSYFGSGPRVFATMPYASSGSCYGSPTQYPNGVDADIVLSPTSHEMFEAYSDPKLDAWYNDATGNENGDNCAYQYGQVEPDGTNLVLWGHRYQMQLEWSNALPGGCVKRIGPASQPTLTGSAAFGTVPRGTTAFKDILIQNTAAGDLNLLNVRLGASAPAEFSIDPSSPRWATLESGESVVMRVAFAPSGAATSAAPLSTSLVVDTDQPGVETQNIAVSGTIGLPKAALSGLLNYGIACASLPIDLPLTVTNTGFAPLTINSVTIAGGSTPGLSVLTPPVLPQTIAVGANLSFTIRFAAPAGFSGAITGSVVVATTDPANPSQSIPVSGTAGAPVVTLNASALDFGGVATDNRTSPFFRDRTITIGNTGTCALSLTADGIAGTNAADFTVVGGPALPLSIGAGSSQSLTIRFNPSAPGARAATLTVGSSDLAHPSLAVPLTGTGLTPAIQTSSDKLVFPPTVILSQAPAYVGTVQNLTVKNVGQAELIVDAMGTTGAPFSAPGATNPPARFAASDGFIEPVTFGPTTVGNFTGTFNVADTNPEGPVAKAVALCGEGVQRGIRVLAVNNKGVPIAQLAKLHLQAHGTAQSVNLNLLNLSLAGVPTSCDPTEQAQYENQTLPATDTLNQKSSYYNLDVTAGGKATSITFTLGVSEFKTLVVTIK